MRIKRKGIRISNKSLELFLDCNLSTLIMEPEFITYQKFNDIVLANALAESLKSHTIPYLVEEEAPVFDPSFAFREAITEYAVKIKGSDFEQVNQLLAKDEAASIDNVEKDYYLFDFTDDELMELITKADEWSVFDNLLARKILADRGKVITDNDISHIKEQRIEELKEPDAPQTTWVIIGYITAFLGGILGLFIGWHLSSFKKTLPNGEKVYGYSENDRRQGKIILYIAIVMICLFTIVKVIVAYRGY